MLTGIIIESSLNDTSVLKELVILKSWKDGNWKLHRVEINRNQAVGMAKYLADGPWYIHFWKQGDDDVLVIFKDKTFDIKFSDRTTWTNAMEYGKSLGIPTEQLDFPIN